MDHYHIKQCRILSINSIRFEDGSSLEPWSVFIEKNMQNGEIIRHLRLCLGHGQGGGNQQKGWKRTWTEKCCRLTWIHHGSIMNPPSKASTRSSRALHPTHPNTIIWKHVTLNQCHDVLGPFLTIHAAARRQPVSRPFCSLSHRPKAPSYWSLKAGNLWNGNWPKAEPLQNPYGELQDFEVTGSNFCSHWRFKLNDWKNH